MAKTLLIVIAVFYFAFGIGNLIKHIEKVKPLSALGIILLIPLQSIIGTIMLGRKAYKLCRKDIMKEDKLKQFGISRSFALTIAVIKVSFRFMPTFASNITLDALYRKESSMNSIKQAKNKFAGQICEMLGHC